jgi:hypothetical protein
MVAQDCEKHLSIKCDMCLTRKSTTYIFLLFRFTMCFLCEQATPVSHYLQQRGLPQPVISVQQLPSPNSSQIHQHYGTVCHGYDIRQRQEQALHNIGAWILPATPQDSKGRGELGDRYGCKLESLVCSYYPGLHSPTNLARDCPCCRAHIRSVRSSSLAQLREDLVAPQSSVCTEAFINLVAPFKDASGEISLQIPCICVDLACSCLTSAQPKCVKELNGGAVRKL